ncbi:hypothetical protein [Parvularcula maris]|uniref:Uncharacterized protein n=1 Tax=Parvularcula maris TaxID=2965077 RepID=A0A9X2L812_9PROT|nr:hypothetical protein [Parvularcula maris]MCQ8184804.1 hypothetical protein [Parvularcula maris]
MRMILMAAVAALPAAGKAEVRTGDHGIVVASNADKTQEAMGELKAAATAFERTFGVAPPRGIVMEEGSSEPVAEDGFAWIMPWDFGGAEEGPDPKIVASMRTQIVEQLSAGGRTPSETEVDAVLAKGLAQLGPRKKKTEVKPLRHEIAHALYRTALWPAADGQRQYGGGAPDWLDEIAAVAAEDEVLTAKRRARFEAMAADDRLIPLEEFFTMEHPLFGAVTKMLDERGRTNGVIRMTAEDFEAMDVDVKGAPLDFYAQARGVLDYLNQEATQPHVLTAMTEALRSGDTMEGFLRQRGEEYGLPRGLRGMERELKASAR